MSPALGPLAQPTEASPGPDSDDLEWERSIEAQARQERARHDVQQWEGFVEQRSPTSEANEWFSHWEHEEREARYTRRMIDNMDQLLDRDSDSS